MTPAAILWVLMHRVYPHATYGDTKVIQLFYNQNPANVVPFLLVIVPTAYTYKRAVGRLTWLEGPQAALLLGTFLYFCAWVVLGRLEEVRIFIPFALALAPLRC